MYTGASDKMESRAPIKEMISDDRRTGRRVLWIVFSFFATFITVDAVFVTVALRTNPGVVTEQAYEKGLAYNKVFEWQKDQKNMGYQGEITWEEDRLSVDLRDLQGRIVSGCMLNATFSRPLADDPDIHVQLHEEKGVYLAKVPSVAPGPWRIQIVADTPKGEFYMTRDILQK